jgi:UDP-N-acetylglucosamine transferase subunit ALG13
MNVLATVGTGLEPFDRFIEALDAAIERAGVEVVGLCQTGSCRRQSRRLDNVVRMSRGQFEQRMAEADVVVCHAGVGTLRAAIGAGHVPYALPRRSDLKEVVNDHQVDIVSALEARGFVRGFADADHLCTLLRTGPRRSSRPAVNHRAVPAEVVAAVELPARATALSRLSVAALRILAATAPHLDSLLYRP